VCFEGACSVLNGLEIDNGLRYGSTSTSSHKQWKPPHKRRVLRRHHNGYMRRFLPTSHLSPIRGASKTAQLPHDSVQQKQNPDPPAWAAARRKGTLSRSQPFQQTILERNWGVPVVMDPVSALGLAAAVVQFASFTSKVVAVLLATSDSVSGLPSDIFSRCPDLIQVAFPVRWGGKANSPWTIGEMRSAIHTLVAQVQIPCKFCFLSTAWMSSTASTSTSARACCPWQARRASSSVCRAAPGIFSRNHLAKTNGGKSTSMSSPEETSQSTYMTGCTGIHDGEGWGLRRPELMLSSAPLPRRPRAYFYRSSSSPTS